MESSYSVPGIELMIINSFLSTQGGALLLSLFSAEKRGSDHNLPTITQLLINRAGV